MKCSKCKFWGDGNGTGNAYDAGHVNYCQNPQIKGEHHPSLTTSKLILEGNASLNQIILTRHDFGCILFEPIYIKVGK